VVVQVVFWGHPISQAVPSIDYALTSELFETGADPSVWNRRYHPQPLLLQGLTTYFPRPGVEMAGNGKGRESLPPLRRLDLGLPEGVAVYLVCQTVMKLHPGLDEALGGILAADPTGRVVITFNPSQRGWVARLERRLARALGPDMERVILMPARPRQVGGVKGRGRWPALWSRFGVEWWRGRDAQPVGFLVWGRSSMPCLGWWMWPWTPFPSAAGEWLTPIATDDGLWR
jgi:hypothetical protein